VVDLLEVVLKARAEEERIAPAYIGTRRDLLELVRRELRFGDASSNDTTEEQSLRILTGWRREMVGDCLLRLLREESHVRIDRKKPRIRIVE
jgi:ribonuclease D